MVQDTLLLLLSFLSFRILDKVIYGSGRPPTHSVTEGDPDFCFSYLCPLSSGIAGLCPYGHCVSTCLCVHLPVKVRGQSLVMFPRYHLHFCFLKQGFFTMWNSLDSETQGSSYSPLLGYKHRAITAFSLCHGIGPGDQIHVLILKRQAPH